jgi:hypothetical protein
MITSSLDISSASRRRRPEIVVRLAGILLGGLAVGVVVGLTLPAR